MRRREFITLIGGALVGERPFTACAQQSGRMKRVAMVHSAMKPDDMRTGGDPNYAVIFEEMKRLGYAEGVNLIVDRYSAEGRFDRFPEIARNVVANSPDVIFAVQTTLVLALQSETRTIPIVGWTGDPVAAGIVSSLARPGGNVTGLSIVASPEHGSKRIQLLAEAVGKPSNFRVMSIATEWQDATGKSTRDGAEKLKILLRFEPLQSPISEAEYRRAFEATQRDHVDGVLITGSAENDTNRHLLGRLAQQYHLPVLCTYVDTVEAGALMSYAPDLKSEARRLAGQIVEILNGGNPAEMPFFQETHWELVINLRAAKELGLEIPAGLVAQADRVIE
jgi:putative tryptophan/tyrosine transport system substrate-binding protein